jgi:hypothetical protein
VPLNSPDRSRALHLAREFGEHCLIGAGTVRGRDVASPTRAAAHRHAARRRRDRAQGRPALVCLPGVAGPRRSRRSTRAPTASRCFRGALSPAVLKAWRAVLPKAPRVSGRRHPSRNMAPYWVVGASGSARLEYQPGAAPDAVRAVARNTRPDSRRSGKG